MSVYDFSVQDNQGNNVDLSSYKGKVLLIVNTATKCGLTPQYEELEALYKKLQKSGLEILDFPCNQFLEQAPGSAEEIQSFCQLNYGTTFPQFAKVDVNGDKTAPLFAYLKTEKPQDKENAGSAMLKGKLAELGQTREGAEIKWNFTKFLIGRDGEVLERFSPTVSGEELEAAVEAVL